MSNASELAASLTQRQKQALNILAKAERPLRNKDFRERFAPDGRRTTGWAKALGPCTKPRDHDLASLWARELVTVVDNFAYTITARGREVVNATASGAAIDAKVECERSCAPLSHSVDPATALRTSEERRHPMLLAEGPQSEFALPPPSVISKGELETLGLRAREAVACCYCFVNDRAQQWGHVPRRPAQRPDDVAFAPWIGRRYWLTAPRVGVMMLNPGHANAPHRLKRRDLGHQFRDGVIDYNEYIQRLTRFVPEWGFGRVVRWLHALGLEPERIAFLNVALCAVADDKYFPALFDTCFHRHTRGLLACLKPDVVLLCGKKELAVYETRIASTGPEVILTWHYRPMDTRAGRRELERVREKLDRLGC